MEIKRGKIDSAIKVVVYGPEGIGKSTFASHFPDALFMDVEGSTKQLDVARLPDPSSWDMVQRQLMWVLKNKPCKTLIIDTADWAEGLCKEYILANQGWNSIEDPGYGKGFTILEEVWGRFLNRLTEIVDSGIHVVLTAHAGLRKFEKPDELGAYDRWELKLEKKTASITKEWADMVLFADYKTTILTDSKTKSRIATGGERVMYSNHHPAWDAKNRFGLKEELPFKFSEIEKHFKVFNQDSPKEEKKEPELKKEISPEAPEVKKEDSKPEHMPKALWDILKSYHLTEDQLLQAIYKKGHFPEGTTPEVIAGVDGYLEQIVAKWSESIYPFIVEQGIDIPF